MDINTLNLIMTRYSCRKFNKEFKLPIDSLRILLAAVKSAPFASGGPRRHVKFMDSNKELCVACVCQSQVADASLVFMFYGIDTEAKMRNGHFKYLADCYAAAITLDIAAQALEYQTCWIGNFYPDQVSKIFNLQESEIPVIIVLVGKKAKI